MAKVKQAIKPDFYANFPIIKKDLEAKAKGASEEERALYALSLTNGWKILEDYIKEWMNELDRLTDVALEGGASFEEIGRNTIVISFVKGIVQKILNKVKDSKEACEQ